MYCNMILCTCKEIKTLKESEKMIPLTKCGRATTRIFIDRQDSDKKGTGYDRNHENNCI